MFLIYKVRAVTPIVISSIKDIRTKINRLVLPLEFFLLPFKELIFLFLEFDIITPPKNILPNNVKTIKGYCIDVPINNIIESEHFGKEGRNMDFSALVLMEKDKETGHLVKEIGSYGVNEGAIYVNKLYLIDGEVNLYFHIDKDVDDWEYSAIFDLFNLEAFQGLGYKIEELDNEFNPTWMVSFPFDEEHEEVLAILNELCTLIKDNIEKVFEDIKDKKADYEE